MKTRLEIKGIKNLEYSELWTETLKLGVVKESSDRYEFWLKYGTLNIIVMMSKLAKVTSHARTGLSGFEVSLTTRVGSPLHKRVDETLITSLANPHDFAQTLKNHIHTNKSKLGLT
jgi:hypothetical protein